MINTPRLLALALAASTAAPALSQQSMSDIAEVTLLPGWRTESGTHIAALRVVLAPGWKTYWRAPGDAGIPPRFDWAGSRNVSGVAFHWPVPHIDVQNGMTTLVYKEDVILPIEITPEHKNGVIDVQAAVELGVCYDVCVPLRVSVSAELGQTGKTDPRIRAAIADTPHSANEGSVTNAQCDVAPIKDGMRVTATVSMPPLSTGEFAVIEHDDQTIWVSEADVQRNGGTLVAIADLVPPTSKPFSLQRSDLMITVFGNGQAVEIHSCTG